MKYVHRQHPNHACIKTLENSDFKKGGGIFSIFKNIYN